MRVQNCLLKVVIGGLALLAAPALLMAADVKIPDGWRMPTEAELKAAWRNKDANQFATVSGDFNGDGIPDDARFLISRDSKRFELFVSLSDNSGGFRTHRLGIKAGIAQLDAMGISKVVPGVYKTACGKGYWDCGKGETPTISVKHDCIEYFKTESASSYFCWNNQKKSFQRIWISD
jgi:hypothetical protein